jgi:hypothetical protein
MLPNVSVPLVVIGPPVTVNPVEPPEPSTLVTVPDAGDAHFRPVVWVLSAVRIWPLLPTPRRVLALLYVYRSPFVVNGLPAPVGTSAATSVRKVGVALLVPVDGPAHTVLGLCATRAAVRVPDTVTGEPLTVRIDEGRASPTLVTLPALPVDAAVTRP